MNKSLRLYPNRRYFKTKCVNFGTENTNYGKTNYAKQFQINCTNFIFFKGIYFSRTLCVITRLV